MDTILIVVAIICFVLAAFNVKIGEVQLGWLGLAFWAVTAVV